MADKVTEEVSFVATTTGFNELIKQLRTAQAELDKIRGKIGEKAHLKLSKDINRAEQAAKSFAGQEKATTTAVAQNTTAVDKNASAHQKSAKATKQASDNLPRLRYALYDVSTSATVAGLAMLGLGVATVGTAIKMDRQFADVVRTTGTYLDTTGAQTAALRAEFNELFTSLPASWGDLTQIGTLAGQLGIAKQDVAEFTELVVMFASTTDVSVDAAATAFGRLSTLLDVPASQFENLGSAILATGTSSLATESQIVNVSSQIASMGNFAGLTADEVIGLSSSLASVGVQPELARGTITRLFTQITNAVAGGGEKLEAFGRASGQSGEQFAKAWGEDAGGALLNLLQGLGQIEGSGGISVLKELGITASRDVPTVLKLAQNYGLVAEQFDIAANGFAEGTALQEQYGVIAATVAAKLTVLKNNFVELISSLGAGSGALGGVVDFLTQLIGVLDSVVSNPVGQWVATIVVGFTVLGGVLALMAGLATRGAASLFALATAANEMSISGGRAATVSTALTGSFVAMGLSATGATRAVTGLKAALAFTGILAALGVVATSLAVISSESTEAELRLAAFKDGLADAFDADTATFKETGESFRTMGEVAPKAAKATEDLGKAVGNSALEFVGLETKADDTTEALEEMMLAMGAVTEQAIRQNIADMLLGDSADVEKQRQNYERIQSALTMMGVDIEDVVNAFKTGDNDFFTNLSLDAQAAGAELNRTGSATSKYTAENYEAYKALETFANGAQDSNAALELSAETYLLGADAAKTAGVATDEFADSMNSAGAEVALFTDGIFDAINAEYAMIGATYDLGVAIGNNGLDFSATSAAGRANLQALTGSLEAAAKNAGGDAALFASYVQQIMNQMVAAGVTSVRQIGPIAEALASLGGQTGTVVTDQIAMDQLSGQIALGMGSVADETARTAKNANKARKEIRTLLDYVSDLKSVMSDAFDFRFGFQQSADDSLSTFRDLVSAFADARDKVRDLNDEMRSLNAEVSGIEANIMKLQYQLSVAIEYEDSLREAEIRADLEKANADLIKTQNDLVSIQGDLTKAQEDANPSLTGNTDGAIEQREAVLDLVSAYQDQIAAYAATGASQQQIARYTDTLKKKFEDQLRTLGYSNAEIRKYTRAFDDFKQIVNAIPRNLTVTATANTDPAQKALDIFFAKNKDRTINTTQNVRTNYSADNTAANKIARRHALEAQLVVLRKALQSPTGTLKYYESLSKQIATLVKKLNSGSYATGGYTGRGGKYEYAGQVHRGEYVVKKELVNQRTGLPFQDAFNRLSRGVGGGSYAQGGYAAMPSAMMVELSPVDRRLLAAAGNVQLSLNGRIVTQVVNEENKKMRTQGV